MHALAEVSLFVGAVAWLILAAVVLAARVEGGARHSARWLAGACFALAGFGAVELTVRLAHWQLTESSLLDGFFAAALAALAGLAQRVPPAWSRFALKPYGLAAVAVVAIPLELFAIEGCLDTVLRLAIVWQTIALAGGYVHEKRVRTIYGGLENSSDPFFECGKVCLLLEITLALAGFAVAALACNQWTVAAGCALAALISAWLVERRLFPRVERVSLLRQSRGPLVVAALLIAGVAAIERIVPAPQAAAETVSDVDPAAMLPAVQAGPANPADNVKEQLFRCGLAIMPLVGLILMIALLARIPAMQ